MLICFKITRIGVIANNANLIRNNANKLLALFCIDSRCSRLLRYSPFIPSPIAAENAGPKSLINEAISGG